MFLKRRALGAALLAIACVPGLIAATNVGDATTGDADNTPTEPEFVDGEVLVGFKPGTTETQVDSALDEVAALGAEVVGSSTRVVAVEPGTVEEAVAELRTRPDVEYAEPNYIAHTTLSPNDPRYNELYGMTKIAAPSAWDVDTGDGSAVVGVLDTGIDASHPDLAANMWKNPGGIWGCAANTTGYDSINADCNPNDDHYHGTHVSGTVGGVGNNGVGVAGVSWNVKLMGLKVLNSGGSGSYAQIIDGVDRAIAAKNAGVNLRVLSVSLGGPGTSSAMAAAVQRAEDAGIIFVAAAGNDGLNVDTYAFSPCIYATLCVAATDQNDQRAVFSNFGPTKVHIAAPGVGTLSTRPNNTYGELSGTSMATPHVSGAIALLAQSGACRDYSAENLTDLVLSSADTIGNIGIAGNRRLNVGRAMETCADPSSFVVSATPSVATIDSGATVTTTVATTVSTPSQTVELFASGLPAGATATFNPTSITTGGSSTLTIATTAATPTGTHPITITADGQNTRTTIFTLNTFGPPVVLTNGVPLTVSGTSGADQFFTLAVPAGQPSVAFAISEGTGDADLYVRQGSRPTTTTYDCARTGTSSTGNCTIVNPAAGTWYVMLHTSSSFSGVTLRGTYPAPNDFSLSASPSSVTVPVGSTGTTSVVATNTSGVTHNVTLTASGLPAGVTATFSPNPVSTSSTPVEDQVSAAGTSVVTFGTSASTPLGSYPITITGTGAVEHTTTVTLTVLPEPATLTNGVAVTSSGAKDAQSFWKIDVPAGQTLKFTMSGGTGDADLYVRKGSLPSLTSFDCRPYIGGNNETCTFNTTAQATWYVMLNGFAAWTNASLVATYGIAQNEFSVSVSPTSATVAAGSSATATVSTATTSGSSQTVALSASGLPQGTTATFNPSSVTSGNSSTLTLSTSANTPPGAHTITITGTGLQTKTTTFTLTVSAPPAQLTNGVTVTAGGAVGSLQYWKLDVPAGQEKVVFTITGGTGDADMYVRRASVPTTGTYDCRPYLGGNTETCTFNAPASGTWYVMLRGYAAYSNVKLTGTYSTTGGPDLINKTFVRKLTGATGSERVWKLTVPAGQQKLVFTTGSGSGIGNVDMYVQFGQPPTTSSYACRSNKARSAERCVFEAPAAGVYYVMLRGAEEYKTVWLRGLYTD